MEQGPLKTIQLETIRAMGRMLGERFQPRRVVLFGSYARGDAHVHSDVDLLVVMETDAPWFERGVALRRAIAKSWTEPVDLIVRLPTEMAKNEGRPHTLEFEAVTEGVVLYEQG